MADLVMQLRTKFRILAKNNAAALRAIKKMPGKERCLDLCPDNHFAYMDFNETGESRRYLFEDSVSLGEALMHWRWYPEVDKIGNIVKLTFNGLSFGDCDLMLATIAPWVEDGSYIEFATEDGLRFRLDFVGGKMSETNCKKVAGLENAVWDEFWVGKHTIRGSFVHKGMKTWQVHRVDVRRGLSLEFSEEEIAAQFFLELVPEEGAFIFAPQGKFCYVFRVEILKSNKGDTFPFLNYVCKLTD